MTVRARLPKIILKRELTDLRVQSFDIWNTLRAFSSAIEYRSGIRQQLVFPLNNLIRMNIEPGDQLRQDLFAIERGGI